LFAKRRRQNNNTQQINSIYNLKKRKTNIESNINFDFDILLIIKQQVSIFVSIVFATSKEDFSTKFFAS
jgi:hypothetical protein